MKKIGIALAGGGARGAYQIGALKAMKESGFLDFGEIHAISGASIGSINACFLAMDAIEEAERLWLNLEETDLLQNDGKLFQRLAEERFDFIRRGMYRTDHFENWLDEIIDFDAVRKHNVYVTTSHVGGSDCNFFELMTLNIRELFGRETLIRYPSLKDMDDEHIRKTILASCAIPVFFKPVVIDDETYYDGGVLDNTPYKPLIDAGCEEIIVIDLFRINFSRKREEDGVPIRQFFPKRHLRGILNFDKRQIKRRFDLGYGETLERIENEDY